ncbi:MULTISPECIES: hypothetical protein [Nostoc]|uniref:ABC transporter permease n=2 Tax=Nostoc TaxID=1177 RepID=A0ABR8IEY4_9NOSO|nr:MULTISPECIES: hypothetical protein [Nostoc]MBD2565185.1 hypothetical protein [Nostoc linckia FACHB-391]MBD2649581.1 hypothetical protein [Nostoc foliaceum FACHB-393]
MALAQHINIQDAKKVNDYFLWKILLLSTDLLKQLWWHTKAYITVLGIMLLTFASLGFVYIHYLSGKSLSRFFQHETVIEQK